VVFRGRLRDPEDEAGGGPIGEQRIRFAAAELDDSQSIPAICVGDVEETGVAVVGRERD
jgi:hypothetical protein